MSETGSLYEEAQVFLAGVRLFQHRERRLPSLDELAEFTRSSRESVHHMCHRLESLGAVERIRGAFDDRVCLKDPLQAEALRQEEDAPRMEDEVRKWREQRETSLQNVEKMFSEDFGKEKRTELHTQIEEKIRQGGKEERKSPLDGLFRKKDP